MHALTAGPSARTWPGRRLRTTTCPFYSDLFDLGYEAVGEISSRHDTVEHWKEPGREGVVAYVDDRQRPRGFLLWNVWGKVDDARALITAGESIDESTVEGLAG